MEEVETNIQLSRLTGKIAAAKASVKDAVELSGLVDRLADEEPIKITEVVIFLQHGNQDNWEDDQQNAIDDVTRESTPGVAAVGSTSICTKFGYFLGTTGLRTSLTNGGNKL